MKWDMVRLGEVAEFINGGTPSRSRPDFYSGHIPWVTSADIEGGRVELGRTFITESAVAESATRLVDKGALLFVSRTGVGKVAFAPEKLCFSQDITGILPHESKLHPEYLYRCLESKNEYFSRYKRGATIQGVTRQVISDLEIPLPPLKEQKRIAAILDKADTIRRKRQEAINLSDQFLRSVFLDMFGDPVSASWPEHCIADLCVAARTGPFGSSLLHSEFMETGIAVLGIDNAVNNRFEWKERRYITKEKYEELARYTVYPNDVIITIMGTTGRSAVVPEDNPISISTKHLATLTVNKRLLNPHFFSYALHTHPSIRRQIKNTKRGAIMDGLNLGIIKALKLRLPPRQQQETFAQIMAKMQLLQQRVVRSSIDLQRSSLCPFLFNGSRCEIEVVTGR